MTEPLALEFEIFPDHFFYLLAGNILLTSEGVVKLGNYWLKQVLVQHKYNINCNNNKKLAIPLGDFGSASLKCPATTFVGSPYWWDVYYNCYIVLCKLRHQIKF